MNLTAFVSSCTETQVIVDNLKRKLNGNNFYLILNASSEIRQDFNFSRNEFYRCRVEETIE